MIKTLKKNGKCRICWDYNSTKFIIIFLKTLKRELNKIILFNESIFPYFYGRISLEKKISNINNAKVHRIYKRTLTIDIENYFPTIEEKKVYNFFLKKMGISKDISSFLANIVTKNSNLNNRGMESLAQGSPVSPVLAFLVCWETFDKIYRHCLKENIHFTLYADDMSFSSDTLNKKDIYSFVKKELNNIGLRISVNKTRYYDMESSQHKKITGVIINRNGKLGYPYRQKKELKKIYQERMEEKNDKSLQGKKNYHKSINKENKKY